MLLKKGSFSIVSIYLTLIWFVLASFFRKNYTKTGPENIIVLKALTGDVNRMQQDKKLIQQMKNGDSDALRALYIEHKDLLLTLANALST